MTKVFIDGSAGTTGLRIHDRLAAREDIELLTLPEALRKDDTARKEIINAADIVYLCLPDDAAKQAVSFIKGSTRVIDTSTAHRTDEKFVYGMPELTGLCEKIKNAQFVANPGCHASGFIALIAPLVESGIVEKDALLTCTSLTGYSGGGKKMIAEYEAENRDLLLNAPRHYALGGTHKHIKEMLALTGLNYPPAFSPIVAPFYSGMLVTVPLFASQIKGDAEDIKNTYKNYYAGKIIHTVYDKSENGFLSAVGLGGRDDMEISVFGNDERILLAARYDNLGKGASGAAIQNMNIMLGVQEDTGLEF
ncbi:MAG: N-acetyl-gamma-glutamyl-phosphate reductase [Clostridia bacterium]|nr:N-acetyl-gamma-glutamyl-phosphate reductase [Clostridia bacterium]MBQ7289157.1 N-acetyl-gamma-glutamyl-phosphate reductase [Clostridia bacterium]